jgi:type III secretion system (T3SS) SseB-like protein
MSIATDSNTAPAPARPATVSPANVSPATGGPDVESPVTESAAEDSPGEAEAPEEAVELALAAAVADAAHIPDLLDVLRTARLWLPLPADGTPAIRGTAVTLPTVSYLGCDFVPAYSSASLLRQLARAEQPAAAEETVPCLVVRAADLARLLPPSIGIALNAGASESVPVYPQGVAHLAAGSTSSDLDRVTVGPLPVRPDRLLADIAAGLMQIAAVRDASAAWLSVQFVGEGLLISVTLDDPADDSVRDIVAGAIERAAWQAPSQDAGFPIDVTFPGEREADHIDERITAFATPFYRRA